MIYAAVKDLVDRFGEPELVQLSDRDGTGSMGTAVVNRAIADATAFADGYLGRVYQLPLAGCAKPITVPGAAPEYVCPPVLTRMVCDLARYYLYTDLSDDHEAARRYKAAQSDLAGIAAGKTLLSCPWGGTPGVLIGEDVLQPNEAVYSFAPRQIGRDAEQGYR